VSDLADAIVRLEARIIRLEEHAQNGLVDRGELRRETAVLREQVEQLRRIADDAAEDHVDRATLAAAMESLRAAIAQVVERLSLVQRIVFGAVGVILLAVLSSLVALVVRT